MFFLILKKIILKTFVVVPITIEHYAQLLVLIVQLTQPVDGESV